VEAFPDETFTGRVAYVSPAVDQATRTFAIEAIVANDDRRLKPGFFAKGIVGTKLDEDVTAVPEDAVSTMAGVSSVYIVEDGKVTQRAITTGVHQDKLVEVISGLKGKETLASSNLNQLATGTLVHSGKDGDAMPAGGGGGRGRGGNRGGGGNRGEGGRQ